MDGIINVYKEKGFTSHDAVAKLRGILRTRKIGHTGTLDPDAEGVLPICVGSATRLCDMLTDKDKIYETVMLLGRVTDTQDISGKILSEKSLEDSQGQKLSEAYIRETVLSFVGEYLQVPPMYSAVKVNGKKLYELARQGISVEREARPVTVYAIDILSVELPRVTLRISCSKGTYIRTLLHDIGQKLYCGACMETLLRTKAGIFEIKDSLTLQEIEDLQKEGELEQHIYGLESFFSEEARYVIAPEGEKYLANGNELEKDMLCLMQNGTKDRILVYNRKNIFCGLYEWNSEKNRYCPRKMFYVGA